MTQHGRNFTITGAADACGVSRKTITRRLGHLRDAGAYKDGRGEWVIPLSALYTVGFEPGSPSTPNLPPRGVGADLRVTELEAELAEAHRRADIAEAVAHERALQIDELQRTVAALESECADRVSRRHMSAPTSGRGLFARLADALSR